MTSFLRKAAYSVLLPAFSSVRLNDSMKRFLINGGYSSIERARNKQSLSACGANLAIFQEATDQWGEMLLCRSKPEKWL